MRDELKKITKNELKTVLEKHKLWLENGYTIGERADLSYTNLRYANLKGANLEGANFMQADLTEAILTETNLSKAYFTVANLQYADLTKAILIKTDFRHAILDGTNLNGANLDGANLDGAKLDGATVTKKQLEKAFKIDPKYLPKKDIILDTESQIQSLEEEKTALKEKLQQASSTSQKEKERLKQVEAQLEQAEQTIQREKDAKKKTTAQIEAAVKHLKTPNTYITTQINIQYLLVTIYILFTVFAIYIFKDNILKNYHSFKDLIKEKPTFITWLFYASPTILSFSLTILFINQVNARLQNIVRLNERKRYVDSVEGGLQAINALSINNEDARKKILDTMEKIIDHTLQSSEKANEPISLEEKAIEDPLTTLSKIKGLMK